MTLGRLRVAGAVLTCVLIALVVLLLVEPRGGARSGSQSLKTGASTGSDPVAARSAALQDAINEAPTLFSYDYRKLDADLKAARAVTTGDFTRQYDQVSVPAVKPLATKYKVVVKANVLAASVVDDSNRKAIKILLFLNQTVTNTQLSAPRLDANRTVMTMAPVGSGWKVAGVDAI
jgi:Mce-associated membrane protein